MLSLWRLLRYYASDDQLKPRFPGWFNSFHKKKNDKETVITYLSPIPEPITEHQTIVKIFERSRELRKQSNMRYCHITLDVRTAIKAFQVLWNNSQIWNDIIVHLGDFHAMMAFFGAIGCYIEGSGFEEIIFQVGLCSPGCIDGVISGKHYNRSWFVHEAFSEAVFRLFLETLAPLETLNRINTPIESIGDLEDAINDEEVKAYFNQVDLSVKEVLDGKHGATARYWIQYVKMVQMQLSFHHAIKTNNFNLRLASWDKWIPF